MPPPGTPLGSEELLAHSSFLRSLARGLCSDDARADDLVQDTYVAALERPPRERGALRGWLATVARHLAVNRERSEARRAEREPLAARPESQPPEHAALEQLELARRLAEVVLELREPYRTAIYLRYHEGLTPQSIAARQGVPVKTVKTRLARALAELRQRMDERSQRRGTWMPALLALAWPRGSQAALGLPLAAGFAGGIAVKKLALAVAVVAVLALTWQAVRVRAAWPRESARREATPSALHLPGSMESAAAVERAAPAAAPREPLPQVAPPVVATGDLRVELVWMESGLPVAGMCLDALVLDDPAPRRMRAHALTDAKGVAAFAALPAGQARLFAACGFAADAEVVAGESRSMRLEVPAGFEVEGLVVDPEGIPVAGAEIWVQHPSPEWNHCVARSRADGRFLLFGLTNYVQFGARAAGWRPSLQFEAYELPPGPTGRREVTLELLGPGGSAAGRVLDPGGEPVAGALVLLGPRGGMNVDLPSGLRGFQPHPALLATDERGEFALSSDLEPGTQDVHVCARGFPTWEGNIVISAGARAWIEVQLLRPVRIAGRVLNESGAVVQHAEVHASTEHGVEDFMSPFPVAEATTDAKGTFLLDWASPGELELTANVPGRDQLGRARAAVSAAPGDQLEVELVLELGPTIRGRVVDRDGRPLVGWDVRGESNGWVEDRARNRMRSVFLQRRDATDSEGRFVLANLDGNGLSGSEGVHVRVSAPGEIPLPPRAEARSIMPGEQDLELVVETTSTLPARLRGRLVDSSGRAPQDVKLTVWDAGNSAGLFIEHDLATGEFEHETTLPGTYDVRAVRGGNWIFTSDPVELRAGETTDLGALTIGAPGRVGVTLRGVPEEDLRHVRLQLYTERNGDVELERAGEVHRSPPLAVGTWTLQLRSEIWFAADRAVEVREGEVARVEIEAVPSWPVDLAFEQVDPAAQWSRVEVEVRDASDAVVMRGGPWPPQRVYDGMLKLYQLSLPAGRYTAHARTDAGQQAFGTLEISDVLSARGPHRFALR